MGDFAARLAAQFNDPKQVSESLQAYFATAGLTFTGSRFELVAATDRPNEITARDIVAVSTLSVDVPPSVSIWLLSDEGRRQTGTLLEQVPVDVEIWDPEAGDLLARGGPLWDLWDLLGMESWPAPNPANDMGPTKTSKLLAAKRPKLVPVWDSVVDHVLGGLDDSWANMRTALSDDQLRETIVSATRNAPNHVSLLRRIDAVIWYQNRHAA